jgi:hypothetical protein
MLNGCSGIRNHRINIARRSRVIGRQLGVTCLIDLRSIQITLHSTILSHYTLALTQLQEILGKFRQNFRRFSSLESGAFIPRSVVDKKLQLVSQFVNF